MVYSRIIESFTRIYTLMIKDVKDLGGRPEIVLMDEQIVEIEELSAHLTTGQIADYYGIDRDTFLAIRKRQPEVSRQYKKGRSKKILKLSKKLENKSMGVDESGDTTSLIFSLKVIGEWSEKQVIETKDITSQARSINLNRRVKNEGN